MSAILEWYDTASIYMTTQHNNLFNHEMANEDMKNRVSYFSVAFEGYKFRMSEIT